MHAVQMHVTAYRLTWSASKQPPKQSCSPPSASAPPGSSGAVRPLYELATAPRMCMSNTGTEANRPPIVASTSMHACKETWGIAEPSTGRSHSGRDPRCWALGACMGDAGSLHALTWPCACCSNSSSSGRHMRACAHERVRISGAVHICAVRLTEEPVHVDLRQAAVAAVPRHRQVVPCAVALHHARRLPHARACTRTRSNQPARWCICARRAATAAEGALWYDSWVWCDVMFDQAGRDAVMAWHGSAPWWSLMWRCSPRGSSHSACLQHACVRVRHGPQKAYCMPNAYICMYVCVDGLRTFAPQGGLDGTQFCSCHGPLCGAVRHT